MFLLRLWLVLTSHLMNLNMSYIQEDPDKIRHILLHLLFYHFNYLFETNIMIQFNSLSQEDIFSPSLYLVSIIYLMITTSIKSDACEKDIKSQKKKSFRLSNLTHFLLNRTHCTDPQWNQYKCSCNPCCLIGPCDRIIFKNWHKA